MKHSFRTNLHARRGTIMIVVLGLITIMLGLLLGLTILVHNGIRGAYDYQADVQYYLHLKDDTLCTFCPH